MKIERIAIGGLGMSGSYLMRRLADSGFDVTGFDPKVPDYYIPCGYATNINKLRYYMRKIGIDADEYILSSASKITFSGHDFRPVEFESRGMCTFDKNRLERDMIAGLNTKMERISGEYDLIVDATGVSRSYLGEPESDLLMPAREYLTDASDHPDFHFHFFQGGKGYYWEFPLGDHFHVGAGAINLDVLDANLKQVPHLLITGRKIRLKPLLDQVYTRNIVGIGEAIGTVSPITGEGIIPSLRSAEILFQCMKKGEDREEIVNTYSHEIMKGFRHYNDLYNLLIKVQKGETFHIRDLKSAMLARKDLRNFGIDFRITRVAKHFLS
ncbi:MAG: NAD(P)/FAD-dependent oxidoreductase [Thermoplasmataceae archaeon]